jgi:hypothetical protein
MQENERESVKKVSFVEEISSGIYPKNVVFLQEDG